MPDVTVGWSAWADREPNVTVVHGSGGVAYDIRFHPSGPDVPTALKRFRTEVLSTLIVIKELQDGNRPVGLTPPYDSGETTSTVPKKPASSIRLRHGATIWRLVAIARIGWEGGRTQEATAALDHLRQEFALQETASMWLRELGILAMAALLITGTCIAVFAGLPHFTDNPLGKFSNVLLVIAGAPIGVWLSYALRRPRSDFEHLVALRTEARSVLITLITFLVLSAIISLLFVSRIVTISIGAFTTGIDDPTTASSALLLGFAIGILRPVVSDWIPDVAGAFAVSFDQARRDAGIMGIPQTVEDLLADLPQRATEILTKGEAGQALTQSMTDSVSRAMETRLAAIPQQAADALAEGPASDKLKRSLTEQVLSAFAPPVPVNWCGTVLVEIGLQGGGPNIVSVDGARYTVGLTAGCDYEIRVVFVADRTLTGVGVPITIKDGERAADVPFELRVDAGLTNQAPFHRNVMVPSEGRSDILRFEFRIDSLGTVVQNYAISVSVYQHGFRYGTCLIITEMSPMA
jgi:hypothetical protein